MPAQDYIVIDKSRFEDAVKGYFLWKELNSLIKNSHNRGINFPETISETLLCYVTSFELNRGSAGDAKDTATNEVIECKATSNWDSDLTSFSPSEEFDCLYFIRLNQRTDEVCFYNTQYDSDKLKDIQVSSTKTVKDQQDEGKRPRFSVIDKIINEDNISHFATLNLRTKTITRP